MDLSNLPSDIPDSLRQRLIPDLAVRNLETDVMEAILATGATGDLTILWACYVPQGGGARAMASTSEDPNLFYEVHLTPSREATVRTYNLLETFAPDRA